MRYVGQFLLLLSVACGGQVILDNGQPFDSPNSSDPSDATDATEPSDATDATEPSDATDATDATEPAMRPTPPTRQTA